MDFRVFLSGLQIFAVGALAGAFGLLLFQHYFAFGPGRQTPAERRARFDADLRDSESAYEDLLTAVIAIQRAGGADISSLDPSRARMELRGTPEVRALLNSFIESSPEQRVAFDVSQFSEAFYAHKASLLLDSP